VSAVVCKALREGLADAPRGARNNRHFVTVRFCHWSGYLFGFFGIDLALICGLGREAEGRLLSDLLKKSCTIFVESAS
jgi:hypothetical protein